MNRRSLVCLVLLAVAPVKAAADRREMYAILEVSPAAVSASDPVTGGGGTTKGGVEFGVTALYGVSNRLHLGGALHVGMSKDFPFAPVNLSLPDGTRSQGTDYSNVTSYAATAVAAYRFGLGTAIVPVIQLEAGVASLRYTDIVHVPDGMNIGFQFADSSEVTPDLRASVRADWRVSNHVLAGVGVGATWHPGAKASSGFYLPLYVGWIW